jgi:hypothetical protein
MSSSPRDSGDFCGLVVVRLVIGLLARMGEQWGSFARTSRKTAEDEDDDEEDIG